MSTEAKKIFLGEAQLCQRLTEKEAELIRKFSPELKVLLTQYFSSLINWKSPSDPLRRQVVPSEKELGSSGVEDFCQEKKFQKGKFLIHKYPDRAVILLTSQCFGHCRFCFRRALWSEPGAGMSEFHLKMMMRYLSSHSEIKEVILSGGDPLVLANSQLKKVLKSLSSISHLKLVRIASRCLSFYPSRIDPGLIQILKNSPLPLWFLSHFNHSAELTAQTEKSIKRLREAGIPILNQTVLLKGINDQAEILLELFQKLSQLRIKPYYLFQCDPVPGALHFCTELEQSIALMQNLQKVSGINLPRFAFELPGYGKLSPELGWRLVKRSDYYQLISPSGKVYYYPRIGSIPKTANF